MIQAQAPDTAQSLLLVLALLPVLILSGYIYKKDRLEKEPLWLLLLLLGFGALSAIPVLVISEVTSPLIDLIFSPYVTVFEDGSASITSMRAWYLYQAVDNFLGVALIEEFCKWAVMMLFTRKSREFNCTFDAVVYAVFVSLGFAGLENVLYAFEFGLQTVLMRAVTSVPGHMFFGVIMGFYYSRWKIETVASSLEMTYVHEGRFRLKWPPINGKIALVASLVMPVLGHGLYDFTLSIDGWWMVAAFYIFLILLYIRCFGTVRRMSFEDSGIQSQASALVMRKYKAFF